MNKNHHLLLLFCIVIIALLCSIIPGFNEQVVENTRIDTVGHFISFFMLHWLLTNVAKISVSSAALTLVFYAAASELGQVYLGFRNGEFVDFIADIAGVASFILVTWCRMILKAR